MTSIVLLAIGAVLPLQHLDNVPPGDFIWSQTVSNAVVTAAISKTSFYYESLLQLGRLLEYYSPIDRRVIEQGLGANDDERVNASIYSIRYASSQDAVILLKCAIDMHGNTKNPHIPKSLISSYFVVAHSNRDLMSSMISFQNKAAVDCLLYLIQFTSPENREQLLPLLRKNLRIESVHCYLVCLQHMANLADTDLQMTTKYVQDDRWEVRREAITTLGTLGQKSGPKGREAFRRAFTDKDARVRIAAIETAHRFNGWQGNLFAPDLMKIALNKTDKCSVNALIELASTITSLTEDQLRAIFDLGINGSIAAKVAAIEAAGRMTMPQDDVQSAVCKAIGSASIGEREAAIAVCRWKHWSDATERTVIGHLRKGESVACILVESLTSRAENSRQIEAQIQTLRASNDINLQVLAAGYCLKRNLQSQLAMSLLEKQMRSDDERVAKQAFNAVFLYGTTLEKQRAFLRATKASSWEIRETGRVALPRIEQLDAVCVATLTSTIRRRSDEYSIYWAEQLLMRGQLSQFEFHLVLALDLDDADDARRHLALRTAANWRGLSVTSRFLANWRREPDIESLPIGLSLATTHKGDKKQ